MERAVEAVSTAGVLVVSLEKRGRGGGDGTHRCRPSPCRIVPLLVGLCPSAAGSA